MAAPTAIVTQQALSKGDGSLSALNENTYDYSLSKYPLSGLGTEEIPHYVTFNINLPQFSKYIDTAGGKVNIATATKNNYDTNKSLGGIYQISSSQATSASEVGLLVGATSSAVSAVNNGENNVVTKAFFGGLGSGSSYGAGVAIEQGITLQPKYNRVKKAIAIYMPDTMITSYSHDYNTVSLTEALGVAGQAASIGAGNIGSMAGQVGRNIGADVLQATGLGKYAPKAWSNNVKYNNAQGAEAAGVLGNAVGTVGPGFTDLALKGVNRAINPQAELVFKGTGNRTYQFVFDFQPRSSAESAAILDIIKTFRMYAAPETTKDGNGRYFIPPAQFDISFFFMNVENFNLARISTCVLTDIQVNYAQSGAWATFNDGMPVHINMTLAFKEVDIISRQLISKYNY